MKVLQFVYRLAMITAMLVGMSLAMVASASVATSYDKSNFAAAIEDGDVEQVKHYINAGFDLDAGLGNGWNAMQMAVEYDRPEILEMLLAAGASSNLSGGANLLALGMAAKRGNAELAKMLLAAGVDPNASRYKGDQTRLSYAKEVLVWVRKKNNSSPRAISRIEGIEKVISLMESHTPDPQYVANLRRKHCEWLRDVRCEDDTPDETTAAVATEETDYGVLYGSLAWRETPTHYHWYWVLNAADEGEANTDVGNYCDADVGNTTDCKLGGAFNNGCAAIAVGENDGIVIASGDSTFAARREAITFCNESGGVGCKAVDSVCTADVEDKEAAAKAKQEKETGSVAK